MTTPYLYKWTEISTGMWYVGCRWAIGCSPEETTYYTSSKKVKSFIKANPQNWIKEILEVSHSGEYIRELESTWLWSNDAKNNVLSYNLHNGNGEGAIIKKSRKGISTGPNLKNRGRKRPDVSISNIGNTYGKANKGRLVTDEHRKNISEAKKKGNYTWILVDGKRIYKSK